MNTPPAPSSPFSDSALQSPKNTLHPSDVSTHIAAENPRQRGVTFRVVVFCLLLAAGLGYAIPVIDYKIFNTFLGATHLPPGALGALLVLVLVINPLLRLVSQKWGLSRNEALTVYITCLFSSLVPGHGAENFIVTNLLAPFYFATQENKWLEKLVGQLPDWMSPALHGGYAPGTAGYNAVQDWYVGNGGIVPWAVWTLPLLAWGSIVIASYTMLCCLSIMLRAQWSEKEALSFPLLRLPLELTEDLDRTDKYGAYSRFFRNPMMWAGFGIAVFIQSMRGLNLYYPDFPTFPLELPLWRLFSDAPWNQMGGAEINIFPLAVGISFLLTSEVSFSLWFFYWFMKMQLILIYYLGYMPNAIPDQWGAFPGKPFQGFQMGGAYLMYVGLVLYTGREHLKYIARRAFSPRRVLATQDEKQEALSYPVAFWLFILAFAFMVSWTIVAGVRWDIAIALWISYIVFAIGLTRVAVEGGMLFLLHDASPLGAIGRLLGAGGASWLSPGNGVSSAAFIQSGFVVHMRGFIMPSFVHSFKLAHDRKIPAKPLLALIAAVILISSAMSFITVVRLGYDNSGLSLGHRWWAQDGARMPVRFLDSLANTGAGDALVSWGGLSFGAAFTYIIMIARSRFPGFPLHPVGYLMCLTYPAVKFWFSIFLGWLIKSLIMRFGGADTYRKTTPLFLGLALGDVAMILFWLAIDGWQGRTGHQLMPG